MDLEDPFPATFTLAFALAGLLTGESAHGAFLSVDRAGRGASNGYFEQYKWQPFW
jgi:hypothetical protein